MPRMPLIHPNEPTRLELAQLPTPIVELKNLPKQLDIPPLLVKRDDLTGLEVSGNKIRKLEYLVADAIAQGCDTLVTHGGFQSNHCAPPPAGGARPGLPVPLVLPPPGPRQPTTGNLFLIGLSAPPS